VSAGLAGEDDTSADRIANALGSVADAIHHLAENVYEHQKTSEANAEAVAVAITRISHGGIAGPLGLEALSMAISGSGDPGSFPLTEAVSGGFTAIADAIREGRPGE
jgi:hypothetical protein